MKRYSRYTSLGAVFAEMFDLNTRDLLKNLVFVKGDATCVVVVPVVTKLYNNRIHSSTKTSFFKNERRTSLL